MLQRRIKSIYVISSNIYLIMIFDLVVLFDAGSKYCRSIQISILLFFIWFVYKNIIELQNANSKALGQIEYQLMKGMRLIPFQTKVLINVKDCVPQMIDAVLLLHASKLGVVLGLFVFIVMNEIVISRIENFLEMSKLNIKIIVKHSSKFIKVKFIIFCSKFLLLITNNNQ